MQHLAILSKGEKLRNPRPLRQALRKLARRVRGSRSWGETVRRLRRLHARVAQIRRDAIHKLTHRLATTYGTVVAETLHNRGLVQNRRLAQAIHDASMGELRRQLVYKGVWYASRLVPVPTWYRSSKRCSGCGAVKVDLPLWAVCGLEMDQELRPPSPQKTLAGWDVGTTGAGSPG